MAKLKQNTRHDFECNRWTHANCEGVLPTNQSIQEKIVYWECPACCLPNVLNHIFTVSDLELSNVFSSLDNSLDESSIFNTDEIVTSSPKPSQNRSQKDQGSNRKPKPIKVMLVNCRSLKSERKQHDFLDLVETHKPDIICGQESHIDGSFSTSEVFPTGYIVSRKDRDIHGGRRCFCSCFRSNHFNN